MNAQGIVFNVARFSLHDGPGIRTVVFLKGCPLSCAWCHNPEGMSALPEVFFRPDKCVACGRCALVCPRLGLGVAENGSGCPGADRGAAGLGVSSSVSRALDFPGAADPRGAVSAMKTAPFPGEGCSPGCQACSGACLVGAREAIGKSWDAPKLLDLVLADRAFYDVSDGGVTISGGEPLAQAGFTAEFLAACGKVGLHRAVETSGFASERAFLDCAEQTDLFLFDVKFLDPAAHREWIGVDNAPILRNLRAAARMGVATRIRRPLIGGVNDGDAEMRGLAELALELGVGVDLLPYHDDAEDKYRKRRKPYRLEGMRIPTSERVSKIAKTMSDLGVQVRIGG
ncbi:MAG TPA: glycyl-radical enzyme activating protein [Rectinemataceae bacterium]|nr:glycyl-radical enzyme activating protein [Rectinemataceae bacterium]